MEEESFQPGLTTSCTKCVTQGANENHIPQFSRLVSKIINELLNFVFVLGCLAFWFCLFLGTNENNFIAKRKNTTGQARPTTKELLAY
jgi:hypothetical protein